ncbi:aldo/keto reductase [Leifsonia sp. NPDC058292]|uniref:aldo/keto reductase n=1 Tax=Leifsonia sp. NPDC058292 TaxID=3346428 RepID=UPI0036DABFB4
MDYVRLGRSGLKVSRICLGMMSYGDRSRRNWHLNAEEAEPIIRRAADAGVNFFDTADMYDRGASEQITGRLLAKTFSQRDDYIVATKVFYPMGPGPNEGGLSRKHVMAAIDSSLRRLGTDYIDLYQVHRWDPFTPIEETMDVLNDLVRSGKVRYLGASTMHAWQFAKAQTAARTTGTTQFVSMQNHYNLVYREEEREMIPLCADQGIGVLPYSPLARGLLTGSRTRGESAQTVRSGNDPQADSDYLDDDFTIVDITLDIAAERGVTPAQIALAWLLQNPVVSAPVVGATKIKHLEDALSSLELTLIAEEIVRLESQYRPHKTLEDE